MKKWFALAILLIAGKSYALTNRDDFQVWRVTETATQDGYVFISSGCPCKIWDLTVTSGAVNPGQDTVQFHGSTVTNRYDWNKSVSSTSVFDVDTAGTYYPVDEVFTSSAIYYSKTGPAAVRIKYDTLLTQPKGLERKGRK